MLWVTAEREREALRVLVACEFSGAVRRAFRALGHDAWSCDLLQAEDGSSFHIQDDIRNVPFTKRLCSGDTNDFWDLLVAHPPCTYLARAGARWWPQRQREQEQALEFVRLLLDAPIARIALENPPGAIGTRIRPADQYVQPWQFGHPETKMTGFWLKNLPLLQPTKDVKAEMLALPTKLRNKIHYAAPGPDRWKERSRTYTGLAEAMAAQWGNARLQPGDVDMSLPGSPRGDDNG